MERHGEGTINLSDGTKASGVRIKTTNMRKNKKNQGIFPGEKEFQDSGQNFCENNEPPNGLTRRTHE